MKRFLAALVFIYLASVGAVRAQSILVSTTLVTFQGVPGMIFPETVNVSVTSGSVPITMTAVSSQAWLSVSPTQITATTAPQPVGLEVNPVNLPAANGYEGSVTFSSPGLTDVVVTVVLNVTSSQGSGGAYTSSPTSLKFSSTVNGAQQTAPLTIMAAGSTEVPVTVQALMNNGSGWLSVTPQSGQIASNLSFNLTVFAAPGNLAPNTYTGSINLYANGSASPNISVPVTFTVNAQATGPLVANPSPLSFNFTSGAAPAQNQTLTVSTTSTTVENVTLTPSPSGSWLSVGGNAVADSITVTSNIPTPVTVGVNPTGLSVSTVYNGQITLSSPQLGNFTVPVQVNVGSSFATPLAATPDPINVTIGNGNNATVTQSLTVTPGSTVFNNLSFIAAVSQPSGQTWLSVTPATLQTVAPNSSDVLTVSINPEGLAPGTYNSSSIVLTPAGQGSPLTVPVSLTVGGTASVNISPLNLTFAYQSDTALPPAQNLEISSSAASLGFTVTSSSAGGWLVVNPQGGTTSATPGAPTPLAVTINPGALTAGTYEGTVQVSSTQASNSPQTANVTLVISNQAVLTPNPGYVVFYYQNQSAVFPAQQVVSMSSSGNAIPYTANFSQNSGGQFVTLGSTSGTTPGDLTLSLNPTQVATLGPGNYQGTVQISSNTAGNTPLNLGVLLNIGNSPELVPSQSNFAFNYEVGKATPTSQTLNLTSSGGPLNYTATATSTNCVNFLSVANSTGTTPGSVVLSASASDAPVGLCNGVVNVTAPGAGNSPITIPVTFTVSNLPLLSASPSVVSLITAVGTSPGSQNIAIASTDPNSSISYNISSTTANGGSWLEVGPTSGGTPLNLTLQFKTTSLIAGTYFGTVTLSPTALGAAPIVIPVQVVVSSSVTSTVSPTTMTFNQPFGGSTPLPNTLTIATSTPGLSYSASASISTPSGGSWLILGTSTSKTTPSNVTVSVSGTGLTPGTYNGTITVLIPQATPSVQVIPVTFTIGSSVSIAVSASTLSFTASAGAASPPPTQPVMITSSSGAVAFTTSTSSNLVTVNPTSGTTPQTISIGLNPTVLAGLAASATPYAETVTVTTSVGTLTIDVNVTVQPSTAPVLGAVVNSASSVAGAVSPGEIISIFGANIGPSTAAGLALTPSGKVATTLQGDTVTFNGVPAPLIYVSGGQINAIVPYEVAGQQTVPVQIQFGGSLSAAVNVSVTPTAPAIFSLSQGGGGQGAILNQDNTVNGASNPAAIGSAISIYATGEGLLSPQPATGSVTPGTGTSFPKPVATPIAVTIGGLEAGILYAGEAPGLVSGVLQLNVTIPAGVGSGAQPVVVTVGGANNAQQNITVAIQ